MKTKLKQILTPVLICAVLATSLAIGTVANASGDEVTVLQNSSYSGAIESGRYELKPSSNAVSWGNMELKSGSNVTITVPAGVTLTCTGTSGYLYTQSAYNWTYTMTAAATAGITLPSGATLTFDGAGTVICNGGHSYNAANGTAGTEGGYGFGAFISGANKALLLGGTGGQGGQGAGSGGAGIGGTGMAGGKAGSGEGGDSEKYESPTRLYGDKGESGKSGSAGESMGTLYVLGSVKLTATAGNSGSAGRAGAYSEGGKTNSGDNKTYYDSGWYGNDATGKLYKGKAKMYVMTAFGGCGGGGGAAGVSAAIGGSGGSGGGGAGGSSGGYGVYPLSDGENRGSAVAAQAGGVNGGNGGSSAYPIGATNTAPVASVGGTQGTGGSGGMVYVSANASINGVTGGVGAKLGGGTNSGDGKAAGVTQLCSATVDIKLDGALCKGHSVSLLSGSFTELKETGDGEFFAYLPKDDTTYRVYVDGQDSGYTFKTSENTVSTTINYYTISAKVTLDGAAYAGRTVSLAQNGATKGILVEKDGTYSIVLPLRPIAADNSYDVYVDGAASGKSVTVSASSETPTVNYYTVSVGVTLDGTHYGGHSVALTQNGAFKYALKESGESYTAILPETETPFDVTVDNVLSGVQVSATAAGKNAAVPYKNAAVTLELGSSKWTKQTVTLVNGGTALATTETDGVYKTPLLGSNETVYTVSVNGTATDKTIQMSTDHTAATVSFFTASVTVEKDGAAWSSGATVLLKKGGKTMYTLPYSNGKYTLDGVAGGSYDLYVYGSNSAADTGIDISDSSASASVNYYTVTFSKNVGSAVHAAQILKSGDTPTIPSSPYQAGYTFLGWRTTADGGAEYTPAAVSAATTVYAAWVRPSASLGGYIKCDANGTVNGSGAYYKLPNVSIQGYPLDSACMTTIIVTITNGSLKSAPSGSVWTKTNALDKNGSGKITFRTTTKQTVLATQEFIRSLIWEVSDKTKAHTIQIATYGDTK